MSPEYTKEVQNQVKEESGLKNWAKHVTRYFVNEDI